MSDVGGRQPSISKLRDSTANASPSRVTQQAMASVTMPMAFPKNGQDPDALADYLHQGNLLIVSKRRRNGLIIYKEFHAEFAGPGAAVGGLFDANCTRVIPVGDLSLMPPASHEERQEAYLIRRQWIRLTQQFTDTSVALERAQMILNQFETYFDAATVANVSDEAFALLVGVLPHTIRTARRPSGKLSVKVKA